jgi:hypothetical protein
MHETVILSSKDAVLCALPLVLLLVVTLFRLDEAFVAHKDPEKQDKLAARTRPRHAPMCSDPDGRPWSV